MTFLKGIWKGKTLTEKDQLFGDDSKDWWACFACESPRFNIQQHMVPQHHKGTYKHQAMGWE